MEFIEVLESFIYVVCDNGIEKKYFISNDIPLETELFDLAEKFDFYNTNEKRQFHIELYVFVDGKMIKLNEYNIENY